jgi:putative hydroxymethylpyrimidine transport system ATP-binding protein
MTLSVEVDNLTLHYDDRCLFEGLHFSLPSNKWTAILGKSGVGKSTLLRFIAGLAVSEKKTTVSGRLQTSDGKPLSGRVAYMAQQDLLLPWLSVLDNSLLGFRLRGERVGAALKNKAKKLLEKTGLENAIHYRPQKLSGGMRQRVALVRTLLEDRPVVLMDEPFSALDAVTRLQLQNVAVSLLADKTVLFVTHDPLEALRLGDAVFVLQGSPAFFSAPICPNGSAPRNPADPGLLREQAMLLNKLAEGV